MEQVAERPIDKSKRKRCHLCAPEKHQDIAHSADYRCTENILVNRQHTHAKESASQKTLTNTVAALQCYSLSENSNYIVSQYKFCQYLFEHFRIAF